MSKEVHVPGWTKLSLDPSKIAEHFKGTGPAVRLPNQPHNTG